MISIEEFQEYKVIQIDYEYIRENIDKFLAFAADIPNENWSRDNYYFNLPGKWEHSIGLVDLEDKLLGYIIASEKLSTIHIHKFAVEQKNRSKGFGTLLLKTFERILKRKSSWKISLYTDPKNLGAKRFYEVNGFKHISTADNLYYFERELEFVVAIHQPNFFPWLGYFDKINRSDIFVLLDDAQLQKTGAGWSSRVQLAIMGEAKWFTVPISRQFHGTAAINEVYFDSKVPWRKKLIKTLQSNYSKALYYDEVFGFLTKIIEFSEQNVAKYNINSIKSVIEKLEIQTPLIIASDLKVEAYATERLIAITKMLNGNVYLCGGGAAGYQEDSLFPLSEIELRYQNFMHPVFNQGSKKSFIKGLSIIDALMHCGFDGTKSLLQHGI